MDCTDQGVSVDSFAKRRFVHLTLHNMCNTSLLQLDLLRVLDAHAFENFGRLSDVIIRFVVSIRPLHERRDFACIHVTCFHPFNACELHVRESDTSSVRMILLTLLKELSNSVKPRSITCMTCPPPRNGIITNDTFTSITSPILNVAGSLGLYLRCVSIYNYDGMESISHSFLPPSVTVHSE